MPRISAPTVREHRRNQERALLDAAIGLLADRAVGECTLAEVARRAGLARSSVYAYFASTDELLDAVVDELRPTWIGAVERHLAAADSQSPVEVIRAYVDGTIDLADDDRAVVFAYIHNHDSGERHLRRGRAEAAAFHRTLGEAVVECGATEWETGGALALALAFRAALLVRAGHDRQTVVACTRAFVQDGVS